jgi:4-amino-4-deoxy-L-arabinose transferase-like glycosyltransferase
MNKRTTRYLIGGMIGTAIISLYLINLGKSSIWDSNEAFYVETPREMIQSGQYIIPTFNYKFRLNKPPLSYWVVVIGYKLFGVSVYVQRLMTLFFVVGLWLVVGRFCRFFTADPRYLWAAVVVTALTPRLLVMGRRALIEMLVAFFIAAALCFFFSFYRRGSKRDLVFFYLSLGLGFLAKGPVALILPVGVVLVFLFIQKQWRVLATLRPWLGAGIVLPVILPWYAALYLQMGPPWILRFFLEENIRRFTIGDFGPQRGVLYYPGIFLGDFFPWSLLAIGAVWTLWSIRRRLSAEDRQLLVFLLTWLILPILFFSLSRNKQEYYIMPVYPAGAILIAFLLARLSWPGEWPKLWQGVLHATWAVIGVIGLATAYFLAHILRLDAAAWILGGLVVVAQVLGWRLFHQKDWEKVAVLFCLTVWLFFQMAVLAVIPRLEQFQHIQEFARIIQVESTPADRIGSYDFACPSLCYYTRRPIMELVKKEEFVHVFSQPQTFFCVIRKHNLAILDQHKLPYSILDDRPLVSIRLKDLVSRSKGAADNRLLLIVNKKP